MYGNWKEDKKRIENVIYSMDFYMSKRKREKKFNEIDFIDICKKMAYVMLKWTGETWVGCKKEKEVEDQYQKYWETLNRVIEFLQKRVKNISVLEMDFINSIVYTGFIYRYLGDNFSLSEQIRVEPYFSNIYVSWSKEKKNSYIESKLLGTRTRLYCNIKEPHFGIDIEGFNGFFTTYISEDIVIAKGHEREVVFPTIKNQIYKIEYIEDVEDENGDGEISIVIPRYSNGIDNFGGFKNESIG